MKYIPSFNIISSRVEDQTKTEVKQRINDAVDELYNLPRNPISDTTAFIVKSTTIDLQKMQDPRFKIRNELLILAVDMFPALSNLEPVDQALTQKIWTNMICGIRRGYMNYAERKALELIRIYNESRGRKGEFSRQLITTREELVARHRTDEAASRKRGLLGFMRPKEEKEDALGLEGEFKK